MAISASNNKYRNHRKAKEQSSSRQKSRSSRKFPHESSSANKESASHKRSTVPDKISSDDFYLKAVEFEVWLRSHDLYFDELSTEKVRKLFEKFVRRWNSGRLKQKFYNWDTNREGSSHRWTRHHWKIKAEDDSGAKDPQKGASVAEVSETSKKRQFRGKRGQHEEYLEEMFPRLTGREAALEKRRAISRYHSYEADILPDISDDILMTGGARSNTDDYQALLGRERARQERIAARKQADVSAQLVTYKAKEKRTVEMLLQLANARFKLGDNANS